MEKGLHLRGMLQKLRAIFWVCVVWLMGTGLTQATPIEPLQRVIEVPDGAGSRRMELALDQVFTPGGGIKTVAEQANAEAMTSLVRTLVTTAKESVFLVFYRENSPRSDANRVVLTDEIVIQASDLGAASAGQTQGVRSVEKLDFAPGFYKVTVADSTTTLSISSRLEKTDGITSSEPQFAEYLERKAAPNDPLFSSQWHLKNTGQNSGTAGIDVNVASVWDLYRGEDQIIGIVDDGLERTHEDLFSNYDAADSFDFRDGDNDPSPGVDDFHGTSCAGVAAGQGFNSLGITGVAPKAKLAGIRLIGSAVTNATTATALAYKNDAITIKSNSWGPADGFGYGGGGSIVNAALNTSVTTGRGGKGIVFLWAAGNGKLEGDNSNYDGYAVSPYVIAVAAVSDQGIQASYSEPGANILISAPSSSSRRQGITTTDLMGATGYNVDGTGGEPANLNYTSSFGGTSSACPAAAGVVALILNANPNLTWRAVQDILVRTARKIDLGSSDWTTNSAGLSFNHQYGAGLVDAAAAVALAKTYQNPPDQITSSHLATSLPAALPDNNPAGVQLEIPVSSSVRSLEQVVVEVSATHTARGDINVSVTSPTGVTSVLALTNGDASRNLAAWPYMTTHNWGENPNGIWKVKVSDQGPLGTGTLTKVNLRLIGRSVATPGSGTPPSSGSGSPVAITSHASAQTVSPGYVKISGTASATNGVERVEYQYASFWPAKGKSKYTARPGQEIGLPWIPANGKEDWYLEGDLEPGFHIWNIRSVSSSGVKSSITTFSLFVK